MALIEFFFRQTATIQPFVRDGGAVPIYGAATTRPCRLQRGKYLYSYGGADGTTDQIVGKAKMFCVGDPIPNRSIVTCDGQEFVVLDCAVKNGLADHHLEVLLE